MTADEESREEAEATAKERLVGLLELTLFDGLEDFIVEALEFEIRLFHDFSVLSDEVPRRPSYVRFERYPAGRILVNQGDLTTEFFVILGGRVNAFRTEKGQGTELVDTYGRGDWFGEVSALSNQPALTTAKAEETSDVAVLDARLFKKLYLDDKEEEGPLWTAITERYRERSLLLHLQAAPLFSGISTDELTEIKKGADFVSFQNGDALAAQGDEAKDFFLIRSGAVKCYREEDGRQRVLAYYKANSSFGEHSISTEDRVWPGTYEAMAPTDVVKIPRVVLERLLESGPGVYRLLTGRANLIVSEDGLDEIYGPSVLDADELEVMVHRQSVKGGEPLVIDRRLCIRCNACVDSCAAVHGDHVPRLSKVGTNISTNDVLITACYNCEVPECMAECNYGAIRRDAQGMVRFVYDNCVGCTFCTHGCPYGVIRITEPQALEPGGRRPNLLQSLLGGVPFLGSFWARKGPVAGEMKVMNIGGEEVTVGGKAVKCDSCAGLPFEACVYNCPTSAIHRRRPEDLFRL